MDAPEEQPEPEAGQEDVTPYARREFLWLLSEREAKGLQTYGTTLQTFKGRDVLRDAKEECIDLWQYLCHWELERESHVRPDGDTLPRVRRRRTQLCRPA